MISCTTCFTKLFLINNNMELFIEDIVTRYWFSEEALDCIEGWGMYRFKRCRL